MNNKQSLTTAIVTNNEDPSKLARVKVKYPWSEGGDESDWMRVTSLMAGKDRGMYFIPEIKDEVLVAFINADINYPIVIGSLWSQNDNPPEANDDGKNNIRKIRSKSGHEIIMDDSEEGKLEFTTSSGHKISLNDGDNEKIKIEDSGGSLIELDSKSGDIVIESVGNLSLKSGANISIESGANISIKAGAQLNLNGSIVNIN